MWKNLHLMLLLCFSSYAKGQPTTMAVDHLDFLLGYEPTSKDSLRFGYINRDWSYAIEPRYEAGSDFFGTYANIFKDGISGIVDKSGEEKLFPKYDLVYKYFSNLLLARKDGKYGFINLNDEVVIPLIYNQVGFFNEGYAPVRLEKKWLILDSLGRSVIYDSNLVIGHHLVYRSMVKFDGYYDDTTRNAKMPKRGLFHLSKGVVIPPKYDNLAGWFDEGLCWVQRDGKKGFVSETGEEVIPVEYDELNWEFKEGLVPAKKNGLWGFIDKHNNEIIPFQYELAYNFSEQLAAVQKNGKVGFIDKENNLVIPFQFDPDWCYQFKEGLSPFKQNGMFGYVDKEGEVIIEPNFNSALYFANGIAHVVLDSKRKCFINKKGKILSPIFHEVWEFQGEVARIIVK